MQTPRSISSCSKALVLEMSFTSKSVFSDGFCTVETLLTAQILVDKDRFFWTVLKSFLLFLYSIDDGVIEEYKQLVEIPSIFKFVFSIQEDEKVKLKEFGIKKKLIEECMWLFKLQEDMQSWKVVAKGDDHNLCCVNIWWSERWKLKELAGS